MAIIGVFIISIWWLNQKSEADATMKKYKFRYRHLLFVPVMLIVVRLAWHTIPMIYNPMRRPASMINNHILRHTPIGMDMEEVIEIIENRRRWGNPEIRRDVGFIHPNPAGSRWNYDGRVAPLFVGEQSIRIRHSYDISVWMFGFYTRNVRILWGFDENGNLIEVYVQSTFSL